MATLVLAGCSGSAVQARQEAEVARLQLEAGDVAGARAAIARALSYRDDQPDILLLDAQIKARSGEYRAAFDAYRTVLAFDPNNLEALVAVAELGVRANERDIARDAIQRALALDPTRPEILLSLGVLLIEEKKYGQAYEAAERLLAASPGDPRGIVLKSRALFLTGKQAESMTELRNAAETRGNNQWISAALLENARATGDVPLMLEQFALLGEANPDSVDLALDEINTMYKAGRRESARERSLAYAGRFGDDSEKMRRLVEIWSEYDSAPLDEANLAYLAKSDRAAARLAIARFYFDRRQQASARLLVEHAPDARYMGLIARLHVRDGSVAGRDMARQILVKDKTNCDALTALTEWNLAKREYQDAILNGQVLATQCTDRIDGYRDQARAYRSLKRPVAVERVYREGIDAHPQDLALTAEFARWLLDSGRREAAVSAVRRLSKLAPARASTWRLYRDVCRDARMPCEATATEGLARAMTEYTLDPLPGVRPTDQLFGRSWV